MASLYRPIGRIANTAAQNCKPKLVNTMFFNEEGILAIDDMVMENASFRRIMEDGVITEEEIKAQSDKVLAMLRSMEVKYSAEQLAEIRDMLVESSVLYALYNIYSIQSISK